MRVTERELVEHGVPQYWRDYCAHILVPLNSCRRATFWSPWRCKELKHAYALCQWNDYVRRRRKIATMYRLRAKAEAEAKGEVWPSPIGVPKEYLPADTSHLESIRV